MENGYRIIFGWDRFEDRESWEEALAEYHIILGLYPTAEPRIYKVSDSSIGDIPVWPREQGGDRV